MQRSHNGTTVLLTHCTSTCDMPHEGAPDWIATESSSLSRFPSGGLDFIRLGGGVRDRFPIFAHSPQVQRYRLPHAALGKFQRSARCDTPRKVRNVGTVPGV